MSTTRGLLVHDDFRRLKGYVFAHPLNEVFLSLLGAWSPQPHDPVATRRRSVETELIDDLLQAGSAQDLLADRLQSIVHVNCDRCLDVFRGYLLRLNENRCLRTVGLWQLEDHTQCRGTDHEGGNDKPPAPSEENLP